MCVVLSFPPHAVDLLEKLLTLDPAKRMSAADAMNHDYFWRVQTCKPREYVTLISGRWSISVLLLPHLD